MPVFRTSRPVQSRDVSALRAVCDGCDAPRATEESCDRASVWLVTAGAFELRAASGRYVVDPSCAMVFAKGDPFTIRHPAGPDTCVSLRGPIADAIAAGGGTRALRISAEQHARIIGAVAACRTGAGEPLAVAEALAAIAPHDHDDGGGEIGGGHGSASGTAREIAEALAWELRIGFAEQRALDEIAASAGTSVFHACRVFRKVTGHTLHGYRRELRLRHAAAMLVDSDVALAQIAAQAGFASQSHLTNLFHARFGVTPGRARAQRSLG